MGLLAAAWIEVGCAPELKLSAAVHFVPPVVKKGTKQAATGDVIRILSGFVPIYCVELGPALNPICLRCRISTFFPGVFCD